MADSLRDQLLKSGIVKQVREEKRAASPKPVRPPPRGNPPARAGGSGEIDLAKAYAIRARTEASERQQAEREAAEQARLKRERKQKVQQLLQGKALNKAEAEQVRHFEYGGKIRRVYVDAAQLAALNAGELGIVQQSGHYLLVERSLAEQVRDIDPHLLALLVEPGAGGIGDDGVPDDLMW
ncbi:DUF2058 family protein [Fulvimonas sp. R45]|uniref:DUF2058 domain-containing protein n=1 Tax=Fulvimonas sp. R45 TaxID=3045937 RepID=UPI00266053B8|nr:DUF2058 family protein [Fulvimonas sp. R45]MDO1528711.1 DUF2058 family protein [Fulvimonas sp. R45]